MQSACFGKCLILARLLEDEASKKWNPLDTPLRSPMEQGFVSAPSFQVAHIFRSSSNSAAMAAFSANINLSFQAPRADFFEYSGDGPFCNFCKIPIRC